MIKYCLHAIKNYYYWDGDDLKFDFWYRLHRHQQIFYEVMKLNGKILNDNKKYNFFFDEQT